MTVTNMRLHRPLRGDVRGMSLPTEFDCGNDTSGQGAAGLGQACAAHGFARKRLTGGSDRGIMAHTLGE